MQDKKLHHLIQRATSELIKSTVDALDDDALKLLLVLVQRTNVELCIRAAVESGVITDAAQALADQADAESFEPKRKFFMDLFKWFPYIWTKDTLEDKGKEYEYGYYGYDKLNDGGKGYGYNLGKAAWILQKALTPLSPSLAHCLPPQLQVLTFGLAAIIVAANAFWLQPGDVHALDVESAFTLYITSGASEEVKAAIMSTVSGLTGPYSTPTYKAKLVEIVLNTHMGSDSKSSGPTPGPSNVA